MRNETLQYIKGENYEEPIALAIILGIAGAKLVENSQRHYPDAGDWRHSLFGNTEEIHIGSG